MYFIFNIKILINHNHILKNISRFFFQNKILITSLSWSLCFIFQLSLSQKLEAQTYAKGMAKFHLVIPQISKTPWAFFSKQHLFLKKSYYHNNDVNSQIHMLLTKPYKKSISLQNSIQIYPSVNWLIHEDLEIKLGRIFFENAFPQIISINKHEDFYYSFDGVFLEYHTKVLNINFWGAFLPKYSFQKQTYGLGLFLDIDSVSEYINQFHIHVSYLEDVLKSSSQKQMSRFGIGLKGDVPLVNLTYTFVFIGHTQGMGLQFKNKIEKMYHIQFMYNMFNFFNSHLSLGLHKDSSKYQAWLYERHKQAGLSDIFLWGNLKYFFLHFNMFPKNIIRINMSFYKFFATSIAQHIRLARFSDFLDPHHTTWPIKNSKNLGQEFNIQIQKTFSKHFSSQLTGIYFIPKFDILNLFKKNYALIQWGITYNF